VTLELGGKDPAYIRPDANIPYSATEIADGALFNSGQSCCAIERVYVHETVYDEFLEKLVQEIKTYKLGDPNGKHSTQTLDFFNYFFRILYSLSFYLDYSSPLKILEKVILHCQFPFSGIRSNLPTFVPVLSLRLFPESRFRSEHR